MADVKKRSKYQEKLRLRKSLAQKIGGAFYSTGKDGKRMPYAMPVLLEMKKQKDAGLLEEVEEDEIVEEN